MAANQTNPFEKGDIVKAPGEFEGTVIDTDGENVTVENRDGDIQEYHKDDLKYAA